MAANIFNVLDGLSLLLQKYYGILEKGIYKGNQQNEPQAVMMLASINYGIRTLNSIRLLLLVDLENAFCSASLARGIFESSIRLLWATRTLKDSHDHWARLQKYWAIEDNKWVEEAIQFPQTQQHAEKISIARKPIIDNEIKSAPNIAGLLKEIEMADQQQGLKPFDNISQFYYSNCYRILCRASHFHPAVLNRNTTNDFVGQTRIACILATNWYCQAICHVTVSDKKTDIETVIKQIMKISNTELS